MTLKKATENLLNSLVRAANRERHMLTKLDLCDNIATIKDAAINDTEKLKQILESYGYNVAA